MVCRKRNRRALFHGDRTRRFRAGRADYRDLLAGTVQQGTVLRSRLLVHAPCSGFADVVDEGLGHRSVGHKHPGVPERLRSPGRRLHPEAPEVQSGTSRVFSDTVRMGRG